MKQHFNRHFPIIMFLFIVAIITGSCKENTLINAKVSPSSNQINVYQTSLACITHTYFDDTAQTSTDLSGVPIYQAVGSVTDPFFGTMTGATFFQVIPAITSGSFFDLNSIDSAILVLPYSGFTFGDTGNTTLTQTYQVFYMTDSLTSIFTPYFSYNTKSVDLAYPLSKPYTINLHNLQDSFSTTGVLIKNYPGLRIPLDTNALLSHLKPAQAAILPSSSTPFADFIASFKGICVRVADTRQSPAAIPYFQLDGSTVYTQAGILVYYHVKGAAIPVPDTSLLTSYYFSTGNCAHFNSISRSYSHFPVNNLFNSTQANDSIIALQYQPGASIDVVIPGLAHLPAGVINKAELQLCLLPGSYNPGNFQLPDKLYPNGIGNANYPGYPILPGLSYILSDYFPTGSVSPLSVLDGYYHGNISHGNRQNIATFTIDIPREVMTSIKAHNDTLHLHINGTQDFYGGFHMVAAGGSYSDTALRPRLFVVYSKLN